MLPDAIRLTEKRFQFISRHVFQIHNRNLVLAFSRAITPERFGNAMDGLVLAVALGQILPRSARAQDPQDAVEDVAPITPGSPAPVRVELLWTMHGPAVKGQGAKANSAQFWQNEKAACLEFLRQFVSFSGNRA